jgi:hypothetical protein
MEVFLGGTANKSTWREELIPMLKIDYFDPIVDDWNEEAQEMELEKRETCDFVLYVITPKMEGVYSIAEVVDDSNKRPEQTILCVLDEDEDKRWTKHQKKSLNSVKKMIFENGATVLDDLDEVAYFLNNYEE